MKSTQDKADTFLAAMEGYMIDDQGKVIYEATQLCLDMINFLATIHKQVAERYAVGDSENAGILCSFYMTLITERSSLELFKDNSQRAEMNAIIDIFKKKDLDFGVSVQTLVYGIYDDIMRNAFFQLDAPNVILRTLFAESVMRMIGSIRFSDDPTLSFANALGGYHFIPMTAYLVSGNLDNYFGMFTDTETYFMERFKEQADGRD